MFPNIVKKGLIVGLFLLSGCNSTPVTITGKMSPDVLSNQILKSKVTDVQVWFCPKGVDIEEEIRDVRSAGFSFIVRNKIKKVSIDKCLEAAIAEDKRSYSIKNIPPGYYTVVAVMEYVNPPALAMPKYLWWLLPSNIKKDDNIDLIFDNANV